MQSSECFELINSIFSNSRKIIIAVMNFALRIQGIKHIVNTASSAAGLLTGQCIAPPEVGNYWQVGEEEGGAEGVVWRYACRMAAGCPQGCRRVYAGGCMV